MTRAARVLLIVVLGGTLLAAASVATAAAAAYRAGSIAVDVQQSAGDRYSVQVPAVLLHAALGLIPDRVVHDAWRGLPHETRAWLPALGVAWNEIQRAPDFVLLEVTAPDEHVRIEKRGGHLLVHVDSGGDDVRIRVPLRTMGRLARRLGAA
jgi:hypothetical protein